MENPETTLIVGRFFEALQLLKNEKAIRGVKTFTDRYGINRRNLYSVKLKPDSGMFQPGWLANLCRDYGVSPSWLLLGEGDFHATSKPDRLQLACK